MGRGKVVLERIEKKINRQVTFSKRRNGLLKKAYELSVLCDVDVALIIFSSRGKLCEFGSSNISQIIERYRQYYYTTQDDNPLEHEPQLFRELTKLKADYESLQHSQRHLLGEDLAALDMKELLNLEEQLDGALSKARQKKTQMMLERMEALREKEHDLEERNKQLKTKLEEVEEHIREIQSLRSVNAIVGSNGIQVQPSQSNPVEIETTLQIGFDEGFGKGKRKGVKLSEMGRHAIDSTILSEDSWNLPQEWLL